MQRVGDSNSGHRDYSGDPVYDIPKSAQETVRATQGIVSHMGFCWDHPSLVAIEIAWRWTFGVPLLLIIWSQVQRILAEVPPESVGLDRLDLQNPWLTSVLLAEALSHYEGPVSLILRWLLPSGIVVWAIVSGVGRLLVLKRMRTIDGPSNYPEISFIAQLPSYVALQGLWAVTLVTCLNFWYRAVGWASATHITVGSQPDLVGYLCWLIFLSLGAFTLWALLSWALSMAPVLLVLDLRDGRWNSLRTLASSFSLGRTLSSKLLEVNLVLAIVKIMLIVLDMVFSAAPLPFADQFGPDALHVLYIVVFMGFLIANDFFQVVRLRAFSKLWSFYRGIG